MRTMLRLGGSERERARAHYVHETLRVKPRELHLSLQGLLRLPAARDLPLVSCFVQARVRSNRVSCQGPSPSQVAAKTRRADEVDLGMGLQITLCSKHVDYYSIQAE